MHLELFEKIANIGKYNVCHATEIVQVLNEQLGEHIDSLEYIDSSKIPDNNSSEGKNNDITNDEVPSKDITNTNDIINTVTS